MEIVEADWLWLVIVGFVIAFVLAFGLGANDVANSFGTSIGSKVLTIRQACLLGTIFEVLGAILVGARVSNTIRKGIISPDLYPNGTEETFMAGNAAALSGSCFWLLAATALKLPVSGTHSIVGATLGFSIVVNGLKGIGWAKLAMIAASWFISPVMSGLVSCGLFLLIDHLVLKKEKPLEPGLRLLPIFYACTLAVNLFSVFYEGSELLHFDKIPLYGTFILTIGPSLIIAVLVRIFIVPRQRTKIFKKCSSEMGEMGQEMIAKDRPDDIEEGITDNNRNTTKILPKETDDLDAEKKREKAREQVQDKPETIGLFSFLQVLTAVFGSFAHGGNDVSNAIGPLVALWITATTGSAAQKAPVPILILVYGGVGISVGLWILGRRVMKTMGEDLTKITPSSGFCIEIGSALTVLVASNIGIPISTTHCKVGSVVCVGRARSRESVDWKLFRNIAIAWLVTLPVSGLLSAGFMAMFRAILGHY